MRHHAERDGTIVKVEARVVLDGGAYQSTSHHVIANATCFSTGPYVVPNAVLDGYAAPVKLGEAHAPVVIAEIVCSSTGSDIAKGTVILERLDGSTWVPVRQNVYTLRGGVSASYAMVFFGSHTTSETTFRVHLTDAGSHGDQFHMYSVNAYTFGLR